MSEFDVTEGLKKLFLASVGAVAMGAEKSQEVVDELVKKGELTVEQGKTLNQELTRKAREVIDGTADKALRSRLEAMTPEERAAAWSAVAEKPEARRAPAVTVGLEAMTPEERAAYAAKVAEMSAEIDAQSVTVDVEGETEDEAE